jgi:putative heme-binding domain-containing protein
MTPLHVNSLIAKRRDTVRCNPALLFRAALPIALFLGAVPSFAQVSGNALAKDSNATAIQQGAALFRPNCSPCHGTKAAGGGRGPDLTSGRWTHGATDHDIFRTITEGVPGTQMPANAMAEEEVRAIIAYLHSLAPPKQDVAVGDKIRGEEFFVSKGCQVCHMVKGKGGLLGPDLSRVGASRSLAYLADSIREPDKDLSLGMIDPTSEFGPPPVLGTVTVVTANGERIVGVAKNEDSFSIQLMDRRQNLHLLLKKDLREVTHEQKSIMPAYSEDMINAEDLRNLLAYLASLRGDTIGE